MHYPLIFVFLVWLGGCQSRVPIEIREPVLGSPGVETVQREIKPYVGQFVRWGGVIVSVENRTNETRMEIVSKVLDDEGRPLKSDVSLGRFFARSEGFLDPAVYRAGREVTVYGAVETLVTRKIGERPYAYPVIRAEKLYLWPEYRYYPYAYPYYPWPGYFYYPYYYPFYPRFGYFPFW